MAALRVSINPELLPEGKVVTETVRKTEVMVMNDVKNGLCQLLMKAYKCHLIPVITPDDIYLQILSTLAEHVNTSPAMVDHYRPFLADPADPNNKTVIFIYRDAGFDLTNDTQMEDVFKEFMTKVCEKSSGSNLLAEMKADFTTTTDITSLVSQMSLAFMVKEFFAMRLCIECGWKAIDLKGSIEDWESIKKKINAFEQIAHPSIKVYIKKCHRSLDIIIKAFKGQVDIQTWKNCFVSQRCGSGGEEWSGFLTDFFNADSYWSPWSQASSRVAYDFGLSDTTGDKNVTINVGPVGVQQCLDGTLSIAYDFFIEPSKAKGFTVIKPEGPKPVQFFSELDFTQGPAYYSRVRYEDQPLHFYVTQQKQFGIVCYKPTNKIFMVPDIQRSLDDIKSVVERVNDVKMISDFARGEMVINWSGNQCMAFQAMKILGLTQKSQEDLPKYIKLSPFVEQDWVVLYKNF